MIRFRVNGEAVELDVAEDMPLLWALRDKLGMTGTKFGCGIAQCGACTVQLDGQAVRSCVMPVGVAAGKDVLTIEGLGDPETLHPVQQAWLDEEVSQCGYCQPGFMLAAAALLRNNPAPSDADIDASISNICRCGTYPRIRRAVHRAADLLKDK